MRNNLLDQYISEASEVAQPILDHLRNLIHEACPTIEENMKWNAPSFEIQGKIICSLMGFKNHVNFIFSNGKELKDEAGILEDIGAKSNMRGIKKITEISNLPNKKILSTYITAAIENANETK